MPLLAVVAWCAALGAHLPSGLVVAVAAVACAAALGAAWRHPRWAATLAAGVLVALAVLTSALVRAEAVRGGPVAALAAERAAVEVVGVVSVDPRTISGPFGDQVLVRLRTEVVVGRGLRQVVSSPLLVLGDPAWRAVPLGARVSTTGRLAPADDDDWRRSCPERRLRSS